MKMFRKRFQEYEKEHCLAGLHASAACSQDKRGRQGNALQSFRKSFSMEKTQVSLGMC